MISYQVVQPFFYPISADTVNEAIKNFVKIHNDINVANLIITDQKNHYQAKFKYFLEDGRNKVGINVNPFHGPIVMGPTYSSYLETLPGATGTPISPIVSAEYPYQIWNPPHSIVTTPYVTTPFIPTIINLDR